LSSTRGGSKIFLSFLSDFSFFINFFSRYDDQLLSQFFFLRFGPKGELFILLKDLKLFLMVNPERRFPSFHFWFLRKVEKIPQNVTFQETISHSIKSGSIWSKKSITSMTNRLKWRFLNLNFDYFNEKK
jgi:hypothetical protein